MKCNMKRYPVTISFLNHFKINEVATFGTVSVFVDINIAFVEQTRMSIQYRFLCRVVFLSGHY